LRPRTIAHSRPHGSRTRSTIRSPGSGTTAGGSIRNRRAESCSAGGGETGRPRPPRR
jgi:hypothetical protein